ncbi:glycosyltransferase family 2 protein [Candidatus Peregrinibacteria bacterium]|nr:glycosyltransferase family 2 protein [bacterium]NCQ54612.1 glycosyltransferase family 2 protein [Candidatus Parcubacteria bacterium]NCS68091.1 glycosyltransferase family 2 protein [Candidatus Peregrinibacteria bacterium]
MKIVAANIVHNAELLIAYAVQSLSWADHIILCNDHCSDNTINILEATRKVLPCKLTIIPPWFDKTMMLINQSGKRDIQREISIRNQFLQTLFNKYDFDAVVLFDSDELFSQELRPIIEKVINEKEYNSVALTCNHLFDKDHYLHIFENSWNGVYLVDPHVRVLTKFQPYEPGEWKDTPDCMLRPTHRTLCLDGAFHYHLKYVSTLDLPNYSLKFLPQKLSREILQIYLRPNRYPHPPDLKEMLEKLLQ